MEALKQLIYVQKWGLWTLFYDIYIPKYILHRCTIMGTHRHNGDIVYFICFDFLNDIHRNCMLTIEKWDFS